MKRLIMIQLLMMVELIIQKILSRNCFQESLLMTHGPVHHKWRSHTFQLVSTRTFVLNVGIQTLIKQKKVNIECSGNTVTSKKRLKWKQGDKRKGKKRLQCSS
ncbi:hypothetical protein GLOIN_2v1504893 [Rhizophagus irregularis DAOM 181602=DAOM 197198]|uniref:Secreted protein n=1 Tax=Rhizophagus irregularis (strain DAOM 181602 / DAOM 197198 / MUCL 43194) TaxID=747089 RepID=A0A2P4PTK0_RHIID|nr:hypothetical protein GLOIN_2v1634342 [Rhizophagus irregularis DAOM 181602=DAOM 197198]XP_025188600.1 hypothetical protein GLOIN_2v1504893 [Rhizophagus irregularis DAOM 181602=DAOM 197198]POG68680.1 hypothetical protein GLOIN_2v1634342 [Rhizophagus irregularis DAOM 181602=DAOM 197198]POG81734.1 hypothetical protein GLOIN_2v1504893 [Rhizophagus irregularis DAOM 181602=DAOM 197198]|eukprot:XP_025175546.1 hypothetical protein GLOIN_2v1634342 [Rhizophagus irregularis DAOM 181602=DAOM 197198]